MCSLDTIYTRARKFNVQNKHLKCGLGASPNERRDATLWQRCPSLILLQKLWLLRSLQSNNRVILKYFLGDNANTEETYQQVHYSLPFTSSLFWQPCCNAPLCTSQSFLQHQFQSETRSFSQRVFYFKEENVGNIWSYALGIKNQQNKFIHKASVVLKQPTCQVPRRAPRNGEVWSIFPTEGGRGFYPSSGVSVGHWKIHISSARSEVNIHINRVLPHSLPEGKKMPIFQENPWIASWFCLQIRTGRAYSSGARETQLKWNANNRDVSPLLTF